MGVRDVALQVAHSKEAGARRARSRAREGKRQSLASSGRMSSQRLMREVQVCACGVGSRGFSFCEVAKGLCKVRLQLELVAACALGVL